MNHVIMHTGSEYFAKSQEYDKEFNEECNKKRNKEPKDYLLRKAGFSSILWQGSLFLYSYDGTFIKTLRVSGEMYINSMKHIIGSLGQEDFIDDKSKNWNRAIGPTAICFNGSNILISNQTFLNKTNKHKEYILHYTGGYLDS